MTIQSTVNQPKGKSKRSHEGAVNGMLKKLKKEDIKTWFDLGLLIDRIRESPPSIKFYGGQKEYKAQIEKGGIGLLSFYFTIDGITVEANKYTHVLKTIFPDTKIHYIAGEIKPEASDLIDSPFQKEIREMDGFDNWPLYNKFFIEKLERGSESYNELILEFWKDTLTIVEKLGRYIEEHEINLLYVINVCSNPGNVSLALAVVLISEYLEIPVINNNHDFYWEGGNREIDISTQGLKKGPRDFFFTNAHVGEFFSIIEMLYPWERKSWMTVNINQIQNNKTVHLNGHNPANVAKIGTAIDINSHLNVSKRSIISAFKQVGAIFSNNKETITVHAAKKHIESARALKPILLGHSRIPRFDFVSNNIVFLQPTRVISRKSIELNFRLISKLLLRQRFRQKLDDNPELKITLLVSGPIPMGQKGYYKQLLSDFSLFLDSLPKEYKSRVYLGFLFSAFDQDEYKQKYNAPIDIWHLYHVASLILLPSQTEGRGLPILEAAASGTPIFCRQYEPKAVYKEVIGYHLDEKDRLRVLEFKSNKLSVGLLNKIIDQVFYPQNNLDDIAHNINVIKNRYSYEVLEENMRSIVDTLAFQLKSLNKEEKEEDILTGIFSDYEKINQNKPADLNAIMNTKTRQYMPGYGQLSFMIYLKSLIDPSFFRVEEQLIKGRVFEYAKRIEKRLRKYTNGTSEDRLHYYNLVAAIFLIQNGEFLIQHDHSLAYRHRNKKRLAYMDYTYQELSGLVNMIHNSVFRPGKRTPILISPQFFTDWELALHQLTNCEVLEIDDRKRLTKMLVTNVPKGYFPGNYIKHEMEYFVLQPFRSRLDLDIEEELTEELIIAEKEKLKPTYIFLHFPDPDSWFSNTHILDYIESGIEPGLTLLYHYGLVKVVKTQQWCKGVHFGQMGPAALKVLREIKESKGFIITNGENACMMTDIINIDHFHIGKAKDKMTAKILGISKNSGFIKFVPAGVRTTLAYPTPIQTAKDFHKALNSAVFSRLVKKHGEEALFAMISKDAEENGTPIVHLLNRLDKAKGKVKQASEAAQRKYIGGIYSDGLPWSGVIAEANTKKNNWKFRAHFAKSGPKNVPDLLEEYAIENASSNPIGLAWNGGYILNPELVGKLGLAEAYIGSPLGLLILNGQVKCPPLFNKPAFIIYENGEISISKVNCSDGFILKTEDEEITFRANGYNTIIKDGPSFFDLNHEQNTITANGHVIIRLAGTTVKEIIHTDAKQSVELIPVGLTLCLPKNLFSAKIFKVEENIEIHLLENESIPIDWSAVSHAIEAGPMLLDEGECVIDMELEGWETKNSIATQAARLDYTDMRGPKIAVGINPQGDLKVLAVNGRIRESVGATHHDMANILKEQGAVKAMGFDPGGSSTLYVNGEIVNISPYNKRYEEDIYALPPEPRFVSNIILGWTEE
ncbi:phosphodiester glycosidase family protein [Crocinitomix catalasitica]|nr:phosphodiester glycosidase family protein [Crocinitomix catalasitica]